MKNSGSLTEEHSARFVFLQGGSKRLPNRVALPVIAMVTDDFLPATTGVGVHVQKVAPELARRGHKVVVLTTRLPGQPAEETWNGVKVYRFFSVPLFGHYQALPSGRAIRRILTENNVVRVHFHYISFMMLRVLNVARSLSIRTVYTAHMTVDHLTQPVLLRPLRGLFKRILQKTGNRFDDIICVSSKQMAQMKTVHPQAQVTFLSNPIDFDGEDVSASNQPHKFVVFYAGRLEPEKNVGYLLHSFRLLLDRRPDAELWIAGRGFQEGELRRHVQSLGLLEKVSFLGHVRHEKLPALYASADVFVLPSLVETQGMVALEAIRFRRPVIVTNRIVSAHELVEDGVTGYIVNPDSASDLADKLVILYDNPVRRRLMGEAGFRRFSFETSEQVVTKLLEVYERQDHAPAPTSVKNPCSVCGEKDRPVESQFVRCNVRQFRDQKFQVWRCSHCGSLNTEKVKDLAVYYKGYPLHNARLNFFNRVWYGNFLKRLVRAGLTKDDRILDYGCGQGLFLEYLKERGYMNGFGFDPHVERYQAPSVLEQNYDWVIGMDVIEHDVNPGAFVSRMASLLKSTGRLCLQTPNADGVVLSKSEEYLHTLHVPYHVQVFSYDGLVDQCRKAGLVPISSTSRYFVDSWQPGTSWAFIQSLLQAGGNDFDVAFEKPRLSLFIKYPSLLFKLFFGYFMYPKKNDQMMVIFKPTSTPLSLMEKPKGSIPEALLRHAQTNSLTTAFWHKVHGNWICTSWEDFWAKVTQLAGVMEQHGLQPGEKVAVILPTSVEWELIDKAALSRGLVVVGIEPHMGWEDMVRVIEETRPRALFVADRAMAVKLSGTEQGVPLPLGEDVPEGQVRGVLSSIKLAVCLERCYDLYEPFMDWATLEREMLGQTNAQNPFPVTADSPASYILTSGTTGDPKGIVYTQGQLLLAAQSILAAMGPFEKGERTLAWLPMASPFQRNMNLAALLAGIPLYFQSDPKQLLQTIKEVRPTLLIGVPRVYEKIYLGVLEKLGRLPLGMGWIMKALLNGAMALAPRSSKERDRLAWPRRAGLKLLRQLFRPVVNLLGGQMRFMVTGSAPCREDVLIFFHAMGIPLLEAYGVSECAVPLSLNRPNDYKIGTVGRPLTSNNLNVEGGDIEVDGPAVFGGYENQSTQTNLTSGKFLSTGDVGELDKEGYLRLVGRKGDLIKTSTGRKIAPAAIEQKLMKYLGAEQAMVVGEGRPYLVAIVCYDGGMTEEQKSSFEKNLAKMNEGLTDHERVRRCVVLDRLFSLERGELTRTLKLRRAHIEQIHGEAL